MAVIIFKYQCLIMLKTFQLATFHAYVAAHFLHFSSWQFPYLFGARAQTTPIYRLVVSDQEPKMDSNRHGDWPLECKVDTWLWFLSRCLAKFSAITPSDQVYIGDLGEDATRRELEEAFDKFGRVRNVWIAKRPPGDLSWPKQSSKSLFRLCFCSYGRSKGRRGCDKGAWWVKNVWQKGEGEFRPATINTPPFKDPRSFSLKWWTLKEN